MRRVFGRLSVFPTGAVLSIPAFARGCASGTKWYTDSHEWARREGAEVTVGVTHYAQENLGDIVFVSLPQVGDVVVAKDVVGEVESVKATSNVYTPVGGTVTSINEKLKDEPGLINKSPEEDGWLLKLKTEEEFKDLMNDEDYKKYLE